MSVNRCFFCTSEETKKCEYCDTLSCSEHLHLHLRKVQNYFRCMPFRVESSDEVGRYLVSSRDISALELILEDDVAVLGPNTDTSPVCLECLAPIVNNDYFECPECSWPLCTSSCFYQSRHHVLLECKVFRELNPKMKVDVDGKGQEYACIAPLRLLLMKELRPQIWKQMQTLMDHDERRDMQDPYWIVLQKNVVDFLLERCKLASNFGAQDVYRAIGILNTNGYHMQTGSMRMTGVSGKALFPNFSLLSHSCLANARYIAEYDVATGGGVVMRVYAQHPIPASTSLCVQYTSFMFDQMRRRRDIRDGWAFQCECERCNDPYELGSLMSAIKCQKEQCQGGNVLPIVDVKDLEADWACDKCGERTEVSEIERLNESYSDLLQTPASNMVLELEQTLAQISMRLMPTHYLVLTVKKYLADMYGSRKGFSLPELNEERLQAKIDFYDDFVRVIDKVDKGYTKWKGTVLFERNRTVLFRAQRDFDLGQMSKDEFVECLGNVDKALKECVLCLSVEPSNSRAHLVLKAAKHTRQNVNELLQFIDFM